MTDGRRNYRLNGSTMGRDLYRLVSIVIGDEPLVHLASDSSDPLRRLRDQYIEDELVHLLVGTATMNRIQEEHMRSFRNDPDEFSFPALTHTCGLLQPNIENDATIPLTLREACNKIIHADMISAEDRGDSLPIGLTLRGALGSRAWIARLNLVEYVRASMQNFDGLT
jgi:hypothetical protein